MCGIAGIFKPNEPILKDDVGAVQRMNLAQKSRGPDGAGIWLDSFNRCVLGHTRLAILDRSEAGRQPMSDDLSMVVLSYNGEIYNYRELRAELSPTYPFRSHTDTEVLLHGFCQWGIEGLVSKLRGMFAFALYDSARRTFYLVRDRLGIKPLYYRQLDNGGVAFASTVKALLATGLPVTENPHALVSFIRWGSVVGNETTVKEIDMVPPATIMHFDTKGQHTLQYWSIENFLPRDETIEPKQVREMLEDVVSRHLQSDVPVGVFLSGGVDSSVLAKLSKCDGITVRFDHDSELDEWRYAKSITEFIPWSESFSNSDMSFYWSEFLSAMDQPSIDGFNMWLAAWIARKEKFPVVLSGLGADELFAGYKHLQRSTWCPYWYYRSVFKPWQIRRVIDTDESGFLTVANATYAEFTRYLHDQLLRDTDWASMAHGVEVRVPYLDHKLVEAILPVSLKLKCQSHKYLLIEAVKDLLPREVWDRPKQGFELPYDRWLKQDADHWQAMAMENSPLKTTGIEWVWKNFRQGKLHWSRAWATVIAAQWKQWT